MTQIQSTYASPAANSGRRPAQTHGQARGWGFACARWTAHAVGVFGYVTAALATFFVGRDAEHAEAELAGAKQLAELRNEMRALRDEIRALPRHPPES